MEASRASVSLGILNLDLVELASKIHIYCVNSIIYLVAYCVHSSLRSVAKVGWSRQSLVEAWRDTQTQHKYKVKSQVSPGRLLTFT